MLTANVFEHVQEKSSPSQQLPVIPAKKRGVQTLTTCLHVHRLTCKIKMEPQLMEKDMSLHGLSFEMLHAVDRHQEVYCNCSSSSGY